MNIIKQMQWQRFISMGILTSWSNIWIVSGKFFCAFNTANKAGFGSSYKKDALFGQHKGLKTIFIFITGELNDQIHD
jgi:hypothetical protein